MEIDEVITCCIEIAEENERISNVIENEGETWTDSGKTYYDICKKRASEHRQFAEWLKELKIQWKINTVLLQTLLDFDLDICCDDLMEDEKEQKICEENCENQCLDCWNRWARLQVKKKESDKE